VLERKRRNERGELEADDDGREGEERKGREEVQPGRAARARDAREGGRADEEGEGDLDCVQVHLVSLENRARREREREQDAPRGKASMLGRVRPAQNGTWNWVAARTRKYLATFVPYAARTERDRKTTERAEARASVRRTVRKRGVSSLPTRSGEGKNGTHR